MARTNDEVLPQPVESRPAGYFSATVRHLWWQRISFRRSLFSSDTTPTYADLNGLSNFPVLCPSTAQLSRFGRVYSFQRINLRCSSDTDPNTCRGKMAVKPSENPSPTSASWPRVQYRLNARQRVSHRTPICGRRNELRVVETATGIVGLASIGPVRTATAPN